MADARNPTPVKGLPTGPAGPYRLVAEEGTPGSFRPAKTASPSSVMRSFAGGASPRLIGAMTPCAAAIASCPRAGYIAREDSQQRTVISAWVVADQSNGSGAQFGWHDTLAHDCFSEQMNFIINALDLQRGNGWPDLRLPIDMHANRVDIEERPMKYT